LDRNSNNPEVGTLGHILVTGMNLSSNPLVAKDNMLPQKKNHFGL
jgi:hypothetical protein